LSDGLVVLEEINNPINIKVPEKKHSTKNFAKALLLLLGTTYILLV